MMIVATAATLSLSAFAGASNTQDFKALGSKVWKSPKATSTIKNTKNDLTIVYGGEDISHKLASDAITG